MKNENSFTITVNDDTAKFIRDVMTYENLKSKLKNGRSTITEEDVIKAAINHFIKDIRNFYKHRIIAEKNDQLLSDYKLKNNIKSFIKEEKKWKSKDLQELTNIDKSNISYILNNRNQPSMDYFLRIWVALDEPPINKLFYRDYE